ncbi:MAG: leucine-rich repeat domain-containing protein [Prevotellaceae bacterium]|jgi:hypothetical protein|nr:leucine-rich repeat domain-containing protein [Prevotellaceae bacterium]
MKKVIIFILSVLFSGAIFAQSSPIEIRTAEEFAALNDSKISLKGDYILMNDITLDEWVPVGGIYENDGLGFSGAFNGNGYTVTIIGFSSSLDNARIGLFGLIEEEGTVKNLCITGNIRYAGSTKFLYIGGIAGVNYGLISGCVSKIALDGSNAYVKDKSSKKTKSLFGYEDGAYGGCIAGINMGIITNCYSTGAILVSNKKTISYAGGIAGANGKPVGGSIGISIGSGGGGISVSQGTVKMDDVISHCYSTASTLSNGGILGVSGGIAGYNHITGVILKCVSLNRTIEANGNRSSANPVASIGLTYYRNPDVFYREDIVTRRYRDGKEQEDKEFSKKNEVAISTTQEESWWRYQDGLSEKQQRQRFGFSFGNDEQSPWVWNDKAKRPVMYWETTEIQDLPDLQLQPFMELMATASAMSNPAKMENSDIEWYIENDMLIVSGTGDIPGAPEWKDRISDVASVIIEDGITGIGHHAFAMSKIVSITIGKDVTSIKTYAFFNCNNLTSVEVKSEIPPKVGAFVFMSTPVGKAKLTVPVGTKAAYEKSKDWKKFGTIEEKNNDE